MSDIFADFFKPVQQSAFTPANDFSKNCWGAHIRMHREKMPELAGVRAAFIGIRYTVADPVHEAPNQIRKYLYSLHQPQFAAPLIDLGDFYLEENLERSCEGLGYVLSELLRMRIIPVLLGGTPELAYAQYLAFDFLKEYAGMVSISSGLDYQPTENETIAGLDYMGKMLMREKPYLFNYSNIGYQTYFVDDEVVEMLGKMYFDLYRLGVARNNMRDIEPIIRSANFITFDVNSIRQGDAPGTAFSSPNGFSGEEACTLTRYAGQSTNLSCLSLCNFVPDKDIDGHTAHLLAQMLWYFAEGLCNKEQEDPLQEPEQFIKYTTSFEKYDFNIVFFKSKKTDRWWMEVPLEGQPGQNKIKRFITPCSLTDYQQACREDIPDRWWHAYHKLNS